MIQQLGLRLSTYFGLPSVPYLGTVEVGSHLSTNIVTQARQTASLVSAGRQTTSPTPYLPLSPSYSKQEGEEGHF